MTKAPKNPPLDLTNRRRSLPGDRHGAAPMLHPHRPLCLTAILILLTALPIFAVDWQHAEDLPRVDFSKLDKTQLAEVLSILRSQDCSCGCGLKLAACLIKDQKCEVSPKTSAEVVQAVLAGKTQEAIIAALPKPKAAPKTPPKSPATQPKPSLGEPVELPIANAPFRGPKKASVTIVEFSDFQCPWCQRTQPFLESILDAYPKDVKLVFKQFPLAKHKRAKLAAEAALAAADRGKFWEMHDKLFANQRSITQDKILVWSKEVGMGHFSRKKFKKAITNHKFAEQVKQDQQDGQKAGVRGTPTLFLNGRLYQGPRTLSAIKPLIEKAIEEHKKS